VCSKFLAGTVEDEPEAVLINAASQINAIGEIKAWWIPAH
jgi:hypothetical protein